MDLGVRYVAEGRMYSILSVNEGHLKNSVHSIDFREFP